MLGSRLSRPLLTYRRSRLRDDATGSLIAGTCTVFMYVHVQWGVLDMIQRLIVHWSLWKTINWFIELMRQINVSIHSSLGWIALHWHWAGNSGQSKRITDRFELCWGGGRFAVHITEDAMHQRHSDINNRLDRKPMGRLLFLPTTLAVT